MVIFIIVFSILVINFLIYYILYKIFGKYIKKMLNSLDNLVKTSQNQQIIPTKDYFQEELEKVKQLVEKSMKKKK